jgi:hypothetical protein
MFQLQLFFLLHCDEWDRVVALPRHKFVTGATLLQLRCEVQHFRKAFPFVVWDKSNTQLVLRMGRRRVPPVWTMSRFVHIKYM